MISALMFKIPIGNLAFTCSLFSHDKCELSNSVGNLLFRELHQPLVRSVGDFNSRIQDYIREDIENE